MKHHTLFSLAVLVALLLLGCSKHPNITIVPQKTDWGVVEVIDSVSSSHILADGRVCTLTPTIIPGGHQVQLATSITNMQADGARHVYSLTSYFYTDQATTFAFDPSNTITLTLHISK